MRLIDHELFEGCESRIEDRCTERFVAATRNMDDALREKAYDTFFRELKEICRRKYAYEFELMWLVMKIAAAKKRLVVAGGPVVCSYIAYLLNITDVDPIARGYELELAYGYYMERSPYMTLLAPFGFREELEDALVQSLGRGMVTVSDDEMIVIGVGSGPDKAESLYDIVLYIHESDLSDRADRSLREMVSKYPGCGFAAVREQVMHKPYPSGKMRDKELAARVRGILVGLMRDENEHEPEIALNAAECVDALFDGTYEGVVRAVAVMHGTALWRKGDDRSAKTAFYTREDVYKYGMRLFGKDKEQAVKLVELVRRGSRRSGASRKMLEEYGADKEIIERIGRIEFLVNEGLCVTVAKLVCFLAENVEQEK